MLYHFKVFKKLGQAGLLGVNKPVEHGGLGLDYKYQMALVEAAGSIRSPGVAMGIGVQTDCATPALARLVYCNKGRIKKPIHNF